ncbi:hypothetical protein MUY14_07925 [Amycolatopsis sp. FBCC-B4732]|uniref:hypothetical protein n=1 Tax=Amycolatopsis sp. FBCC-B4732 TaxID=3079339 RepID=UPI001FF6BCA8|nr:hypothetical protein [Amycolatopsis sp. FBCC-B4732]UOX90540.1 hypothetical protein MUY14_07925 [Amycolatopsis sp. FBCC-B4732]
MLRQLCLIAVAMSAIGVATAGGDIAPSAHASTAQARCSTVWQYRVTNPGNMTDAESGGNYVGDAYVGDLINVRIQGNPRYYGFNTGSSKWGWVLSSNLSYTGNTWCG